MSEVCKIYIDRLTNERVEKISTTIDSKFLAVNEAELHFDPSISVKGSAYLTKNHLIICLNADIRLSQPCKVCNALVSHKISLKNFYHAENLENISGGVYDYSQNLREALLLEIPAFVECNDGKCPDRRELEKYLIDKSSQQSPAEHFPFKNLH